MHINTVRICLSTFGLAILLSTAGCVTPYREHVTQQREDVLLLRETQRRGEGRIESLEVEIDALRDDLARLDRNRTDALRIRSDQLELKFDTLSRKLEQAERTQARDKRETIDTLTKKIEQLLKQQTTASRSTRSNASSGYGYEHTVRSGETLSEIAKAYGVSVDVIIAENAIANPNHLKVGQTLFVPE